MCTFDKILEVAKAKGITQVQLANHLGVGKQAVSEWKKGRSTAYMKRIGKLQNFLVYLLITLLVMKNRTTTRSFLSLCLAPPM